MSSKPDTSSRQPREDLIDEITRAQIDLMRATRAASTPTWLQLHLSMAQLKALIVLSDGGRSVGELGVALGTGKAAASILIDRLVHLGLVDRTEDPRDRRRTLVRLTPEGDRSISQLREVGRERFHEWLDRLDDDDLTALARGMRALARATRTEEGTAAAS